MRKFPRYLDLGGADTKEQITRLIDAVQRLKKDLSLPASIAQCGIPESDFLSKIDILSERAFEDQCTTANPRYPLIRELKEIYKKAYYGE